MLSSSLHAVGERQIKGTLLNDFWIGMRALKIITLDRGKNLSVLLIYLSRNQDQAMYETWD